VLFSTPSLRAGVFGDTSSTDTALAARSRQASLEALELIVNRLESIDCPGLVERVQGRLANVATGYHWPWPSNNNNSNAEAASPERSTTTDEHVGDAETHEEHPLVVAALLVQEDLVIMLPRQKAKNNVDPEKKEPSSRDVSDVEDAEYEEEYALACAAVCFSDQWRVSDKVGLSLHQVFTKCYRCLVMELVPEKETCVHACTCSPPSLCFATNRILHLSFTALIDFLIFACKIYRYGANHATTTNLLP